MASKLVIKPKAAQSKVKPNFRGSKPMVGSTQKTFTTGKGGKVKAGKAKAVGKGTGRNATTGSGG